MQCRLLDTVLPACDPTCVQTVTPKFVNELKAYLKLCIPGQVGLVDEPETEALSEEESEESSEEEEEVEEVSNRKLKHGLRTR